jgi:hypothetical protein
LQLKNEGRKDLPAVEGLLVAVEEDRGIARLRGTKQNLFGQIGYIDPTAYKTFAITDP